MSLPSLKIWLTAIRPKTLSAAIAPVLMGTAMAYGDGIHDFKTAFIALLGALFIQIGTNLSNDYCDYKKGTDTHERIGPIRVTQSGLISPELVRFAAVFCFCVSAVLASFLIKRAGTPIAIIGVLSILSGIFYTAGPRPLGYLGLGELFVLIFFGPVAVAGTYYVQSFEINPAIILAGFAPGLLSCAILTVNNLRDIEGDLRSGKRTLAVRFGRPFAINEYLFFILLACLIPIITYLYIEDNRYILMASFSSILAIPTIKTVSTSIDGPSLNKALASTGKLLLIFCILFSIGWIL